MEIDKIRLRVEKALVKEVEIEKTDKGSDTLFIVKTDEEQLVGKAHSFEGLE